MSIIFFDMDGVIIDSEGLYLDRLKTFLDYKKIKVPENDLLCLVGSNSKRDERIMNNWFGKSFDYDRFIKEKREYFKNNPIDYSKIIMPNIVKTIKELKKCGHNLSLTSSSPLKHILKIVNLLKIRDCFDYIISGENFIESKPNPEIYNYAKSKYNSYSEMIFVVEDSTLGIEAAKAAGLIVIAKKDIRFSFDQSKADYTIDDLLEILDIVK